MPFLNEEVVVGQNGEFSFRVKDRLATLSIPTVRVEALEYS